MSKKDAQLVTTDSRFSVRSLIETIGMVTLCSGLCVPLAQRFDHSITIMIYLAGVAAIASRNGYREATLASALAVAQYDFFFVPPFFTFAVSDTQYFIVFVVMLGVALLISHLTLRLRTQIEDSIERERRNSALFQLTKELSISEKLEDIVFAGVREISSVFNGDSSIIMPDADEVLTVRIPSVSGFESKPSEIAVAQWVYSNGGKAGKGTTVLPGSESLFLPLLASRGTVGVLGIQFDSGQLPPQDNINHLETFLNALSLAIERTQLANESVAARLEVETEKVRNALLSSVSHDLRTPLTVISGTAEDMMESSLGNEALRVQASTIREEANRLNRHLTNLLDMTRLESGIHPKLEWNSLEELLGVALSKTKNIVYPRKIAIDIDATLKLVKVDGVLVEKVFRNLLENIARHTDGSAEVFLKGFNRASTVVIEISDTGPGIPTGKEREIFDKFYQASSIVGESGFGLGLSICKTIMDLHGGVISVSNRKDGGACFRMEFATAKEFDDHSEIMR